MSELENSTDLQRWVSQKNGAPPAAPSRPPTFHITELHARVQLGLSKEEVRALRQERLVENQHWVLHRKRILYCPDGLQRLMEVAGLDGTPAAEETAPGANAAAPEPLKEEVPIEELVVWRTGLRNARILLAHRPGADPEDPAARLRVRVKKDRNFVRGMVIPCRLLPGYTDLFELAHALPRRRGVW